MREADELIPWIRSQLSDDLLLPRERRKQRRTDSAGHCYVAAETLWHMTGTRLHVFQIAHENSSHWFLCDPQTGEIHDPTSDQFATPVPYDTARRRNFRTHVPSRRAAVLICRIIRAGWTPSLLRPDDAQATAHPDSAPIL